MELTANVIAVKQAATQQSASITVMKKQHEMQMSAVNMIDQVAQAAPPPGQGTVVDKTA